MLIRYSKHIVHSYPLSVLFPLRVLNFSFYQKFWESPVWFLLSCPSLPPPLPSRWVGGQSEWKFDINWDSLNIVCWYFVDSEVFGISISIIDLFSPASKFRTKGKILKDIFVHQQPPENIRGVFSSSQWSKVGGWWSGQSKYFFTMFNLQPPSPFITLSLLTQPFIKLFIILSSPHHYCMNMQYY